jgi:hypothetical protein
VQTNGTGKILSKIIAINSPNLEKELPIQVQEDSWTPNRNDQIRNFP